MSNIYIKEPPTDGKVMLHTSMGDIDIELWSKESPIACRNFIQLCMEGYYDKVIFHRVVPGFIVQGGDPTGTGEGGESIYGEPFKDEFHQRLRFVRRGLVAMANAGPNDNGSQFFFTLGPCNDLNKKHTIFGKVTGDTVYNMIRLGEVGTDENERPLNPPFIKWSKVLANPFDDIEPRVVPDRKKHKDDQKKPKSNSRATKDYKLLSFGEEAEVDEEESTEFSFKGSKSSHDLAKDPQLSSVTAVSLGKDEDDSMKRSRENSSSNDDDSSPDQDKKKNNLNKIRNKLNVKKSKTDDQEAPKSQIKEEDSKNDKDSPKRNRAEELRKESKKLARELAGKKHSGRRDESSSASNSEDEDNSASQNPMFAEYKAQQKSYRVKTAENKKKGSSRENETLTMLSNFQTKILAVREEAGSDDDQDTLKKEQSDDDDDEGWMLHKLTKNEEKLRDAKDMNRDVNEDRYDIFDPRNPLNKRRRDKKNKGKSDRRDERRNSPRSSGHRRDRDRRR